MDGSLNFYLAPIIAKTFKIIGLTKYCETFENEDAAIAKLAKCNSIFSSFKSLCDKRETSKQKIDLIVEWLEKKGFQVKFF